MIGQRPHWKGNLLCRSRRIFAQRISVNFEGNKANQYTESSRIKMLPDVGMVKVYPECVLKAANVDWVACGIHLLGPGLFPPVGFSMQLPVVSETLSTMPTSPFVFVGNDFIPLLFMECNLCHVNISHVHTGLD